MYRGLAKLLREAGTGQQLKVTALMLCIFVIVLLREVHTDLYKTLDPPYQDVAFEFNMNVDGSLPLPIHVVFTAFSGRPSKRTIEANTLFCWSNLHSRVQFLALDDTQIEHNRFGTPVLASLFLAAMDQFPSADTYTYINGDILATTNFVSTADFVVNASRSGWMKTRFLIVGQRTNVPWGDVLIDQQTDLAEQLKRGVHDRTDAEDYFVVSRHAFNWSSIPPFVIGRPGYDNWLVNAAFEDPGVDVIDATNTNPVIHQTDQGGKTEWGGAKLTLYDTYYNYKLARRQWTYGTVKCSNWATLWGADQAFAVRRRLVKLGWTQRTQDPTEYLERQW